MGLPVKKDAMTKNLVLSGQNFDKMVVDLRKIIDAGRARAHAAANQALMETYWRCGDRIARERLTENSGYGQSIMERLANELHADRTTLVRLAGFGADHTAAGGRAHIHHGREATAFDFAQRSILVAFFHQDKAVDVAEVCGCGHPCDGLPGRVAFIGERVAGMDHEGALQAAALVGIQQVPGILRRHVCRGTGGLGSTKAEGGTHLGLVTGGIDHPPHEPWR